MIKMYTDTEGVDLFMSLVEADNDNPDAVILSVANGWDISQPVLIPRLELLAMLEAI